MSKHVRKKVSKNKGKKGKNLISGNLKTIDFLELVFPVHFGLENDDELNISINGIRNSCMFVDFRDNAFSFAMMFSDILERKVGIKELNHAALEICVGLMSYDMEMRVKNPEESSPYDIDTEKGVTLMITKGKGKGSVLKFNKLTP